MDYTRPTLSKKRYRLRKIPDHPLADVLGRVYVHREIAHKNIGDLRVPCFWCGSRISFGNSLFVDHLDHDRHNNTLSNLVPSCNGCNAGRTRSNPRVRESVYVFPVGEDGEFVWAGSTDKVGA